MFLDYCTRCLPIPKQSINASQRHQRYVRRTPLSLRPADNKSRHSRSSYPSRTDSGWSTSTRNT